MQSLLLALGLVLGACGGQPGALNDTSEAAAAIVGSKDFTGTLNPTDTSWSRTLFTAAAGSALELTLDWTNPEADLNVFLYDPQGTLVAYSNGTSKPENVSFAALTGGAYSFGIKCKNASSPYRVQVRVSPTRRQTVFGESLDSHGDRAAGVQYALERFGKIPVARIFLSGGEALPRSWSSSAGLTALPVGTDLVLSFKPNAYASSAAAGLANIAAGSADADIRGLLGSHPAGVRVWLSLNHEPEDDMERGDFTSAQYKAAWSQLGGRGSRARGPEGEVGAHPDALHAQYRFAPGLAQ